MGKIEELKQELETQKTKIEEERQQVVAILTEQNTTISQLEEAVANGGSQEQLQELIDKAKENTAALTKIYAAPGEEDEQPEEPGEEQP